MRAKGPAPGPTNEPIPLAALERLLEAATGTAPPLVFEEILGGASVRRFFRVKTGERSVIAMYAPVQSHEIAKAPTQARAWPFLEVQRLLESRGVRVPALVGTACDDGFILVEDLGETLAQHLSRAPENREQLYVTAVRRSCASACSTRTSCAGRSTTFVSGRSKPGESS
jgi:aminoglycoside/choline kinase family phosphotransferase